MSSIAGELVTERLVGYDGGRQVTVYVPPAPAQAVVVSSLASGAVASAPRAQVPYPRHSCY
jgi:hypothetical protein